jgi:hypothetical protein
VGIADRHGRPPAGRRQPEDRMRLIRPIDSEVVAHWFALSFATTSSDSVDDSRCSRTATGERRESRQVAATSTRGGRRDRSARLPPEQRLEVLAAIYPDSADPGGDRIAGPVPATQGSSSQCQAPSPPRTSSGTRPSAVGALASDRGGCGARGRTAAPRAKSGVAVAGSPPRSRTGSGAPPGSPGAIGEKRRPMISRGCGMGIPLVGLCDRAGHSS